MIIVLDESVSYGLAEVLRETGKTVIAIAEASTSGMSDEEIFDIVLKNNAILITRDYHFTNPLRFPPNKTGGVIYIRHGNLTCPSQMFLPIEINKDFIFFDKTYMHYGDNNSANLINRNEFFRRSFIE